MLSVVTVSLFSVYRRGGGLKYSYRRRIYRCLSKQDFNSRCQGLRKNHEIADIEILEHKASYMGQAERIAGEVCAGQTLEVDAISGATFTSDTVLKAIENALK